jgi:hypothetical protein
MLRLGGMVLSRWRIWACLRKFLCNGGTRNRKKMRRNDAGERPLSRGGSGVLFRVTQRTTCRKRLMRIAGRARRQM